MAFIGVSSLQQHSLVLLISCCYHRIVFASCLSISYFSLFLCLNFWPLYFTAALRHPGGNDPLPGGAGRLQSILFQPHRRATNAVERITNRLQSSKRLFETFGSDYTAFLNRQKL